MEGMLYDINEKLISLLSDCTCYKFVWFDPNFLLLSFYRCVACKCQECAQSPKGSEIFNPPLTFVIDTTKSVKPDKDSIFNLTQKGTFCINKFVSKNIKNIILKRSDV